jgi:hypothetical protein
MQISRRKFLVLGGVSAITALYGWYEWHWGDPKDIVVAILNRRVGYLRVDSSTFDTFAKDYLEYRKTYKNELRKLSTFSPLLMSASPYSWLKQGHPYRRLVDNVVSQYLLSTDFFQNGADERRLVTYLSFYNPYTAACRNPFTRQP